MKKNKKLFSFIVCLLLILQVFCTPAQNAIANEYISEQYNFEQFEFEDFDFEDFDFDEYEFDEDELHEDELDQFDFSQFDFDQIDFDQIIFTLLDELNKTPFEDLLMAFLYNLADEDMFDDLEDTVTRGDLAIIGVRLYEKLTGNLEGPNSPNPFKDTDDRDIHKAYLLGLMKEYSLGIFEPFEPVTIEEAITLLYSAIRISEPELNYDVDIEWSSKETDFSSEYSYEAAKYLAAKEIINIKNIEDIKSGQFFTRGEFFILAKKVYEFAMQESNKAAKGLLWKISDENSEVYLLGSIHVADASIYPFDNSIMDAFNSSDYLVVEANLLSGILEYAMYTLEKSFYGNGDSIDKHISPETYKLYSNFMKSIGIGPELYNKFKPWYAYMYISDLNLSEDSYDYSSFLGIDMHLLGKAYGNKEILEIEGVKYQIDLFENFSPELQEYLLASVLAERLENENYEEYFTESMDLLLTLWREGNAEIFEYILNPSKKSDGSAVSTEYAIKLWLRRDRHMAEKIKSYLADEENKTYFVVVGAGHVVGDTGIIRDLINDGYNVEQIID